MTHSDRAPTQPSISDINRDTVAEELPLAFKAIALRRLEDDLLRIDDAAMLLGLYLAEIRHGLLHVIRPEGALGENFQLCIEGAGRLRIHTRIARREGEWITLEVLDPDLVAKHLDRVKPLWESTLRHLVEKSGPGEDKPVHTRSKPQMSTRPTPPKGAPPPRSRKPARGVRLTSPKSPETTEPKAPSDEPARDPGPPARAPSDRKDATQDAHAELPTLTDGIVTFADVAQLKLELKSNLKNGGLLVRAAPLPLRSRQTLELVTPGSDPILKLEADVVFANGGRLGLSLVDAAGTIEKLSAFLEGQDPNHPNPPTKATVDVVPEELQQATKQKPPKDLVPAFRGTLSSPSAISDVLSFQRKRASGPQDLQNATALSVFDYVVRKNGRGVLTLETQGKCLRVYVHRGSVAFVKTTPFDPETGLGRILVTQKKINESALREALEESKTRRKSLGRTLIALGRLSKSDLSSALREQARVKLDLAFAWPGGHYQWSLWEEPPGDADLVLTKGLGILGRHFRTRYEALGSTELQRLYGKKLGQIAVVDEDLDKVCATLQLQQKEVRFLQLQFDGSRTILEAVTGSPIGRLGSLRILGLALSSGLLHIQDPGAPTGELTGPIAASIRILEKELGTRLEHLKGMNHFEVLGVHWSAHHSSFREAFEKAKREFNTTAPPLRSAPENVKSIADEAKKLVEQAYGLLINHGMRVRYRKQLFDATERQYAADMLVKQGEMALMRGDRVQAIEALETAVELDGSKRNASLLSTAREGRR